jgi:putative transposase
MLRCAQLNLLGINNLFGSLLSESAYSGTPHKQQYAVNRILWHWDFHEGSRNILTRHGELVAPALFGSLDDRSRVACHCQWYLIEDAENVSHGLQQSFQKRGLPRSGLSDNGGAMIAAEIREGLHRLGIVHETILPRCAFANGKIETLWTQIEGRLLPMLEDVPDLTLSFLNEATQAWVEYEYNRIRYCAEV